MANGSQLAPTETKVADLLVEGYGPQAIGQRLGVATSTASTHIGRIRSKLGARSTIHAAVIWARTKAPQ